MEAYLQPAMHYNTNNLEITNKQRRHHVTGTQKHKLDSTRKRFRHYCRRINCFRCRCIACIYLPCSSPSRPFRVLCIAHCALCVFIFLPFALDFYPMLFVFSGFRQFIALFSQMFVFHARDLFFIQYYNSRTLPQFIAKNPWVVTYYLLRCFGVPAPSQE